MEYPLVNRCIVNLISIGGYMREKYESLALVQLKELAKVRGLKGTSTMKKADLVEAMLAEDERLKKEEEAKAAEELSLIHISEPTRH